MFLAQLSFNQASESGLNRMNHGLQWDLRGKRASFICANSAGTAVLLRTKDHSESKMCNSPGGHKGAQRNF